MAFFKENYTVLLQFSGNHPGKKRFRKMKNVKKTNIKEQNNKTFFCFDIQKHKFLLNRAIRESTREIRN